MVIGSQWNQLIKSQIMDFQPVYKSFTKYGSSHKMLFIKNKLMKKEKKAPLS